MEPFLFVMKIFLLISPDFSSVSFSLFSALMVVCQTTSLSRSGRDRTLISCSASHKVQDFDLGGFDLVILVREL